MLTDKVHMSTVDMCLAAAVLGFLEEFFSQFWSFNKSYFKNDPTEILFSVLALFVMPVQLTRLDVTVDPRRVLTADSTPRWIESP
jgi:hypothetical protein